MCDCIELMNIALEPLNARLDIPLQISMTTGERVESRVPMPVFKINPKKRARLPALLANFCPMCGQQYPTKEVSGE